jgi:hypothetical protein
MIKQANEKLHINNFNSIFARQPCKFNLRAARRLVFPYQKRNEFMRHSMDSQALGARLPKSSLPTLDRLTCPVSLRSWNKPFI